MTEEETLKLAREVIEKYGKDTDKPSVHLARALLARPAVAIVNGEDDGSIRRVFVTYNDLKQIRFAEKLLTEEYGEYVIRACSLLARIAGTIDEEDDREVEARLAHAVLRGPSGCDCCDDLARVVLSQQDELALAKKFLGQWGRAPEDIQRRIDELNEKVRIAEAVRDDARLASMRDLEARREATAAQDVLIIAPPDYTEGWKRGVLESIDKLEAFQHSVGGLTYSKAIELLGILLQNPRQPIPRTEDPDPDPEPYEGSFCEAADNEGARIARELTEDES